MTLCEKCRTRFGDDRKESVCAHGGGDAHAFDGGTARAYGGGDAVAFNGGNSYAFDGGTARAYGGGDARAFDGGDARAYGGGDARANGGGDAHTYGGGTETDFRGVRRPVDHEDISYYDCSAGDGWLRVGCELHTYEDWIANADEIDEKHGDGIADITRALAERCAAEEEKE